MDIIKLYVHWHESREIIEFFKVSLTERAMIMSRDKQLWAKFQNVVPTAELVALERYM